MFSVKVVTSDDRVREFSAKSFYQVVMGEGKLKVSWVTPEGKDESVTYTRIRTIVEKKLNL